MDRICEAVKDAKLYAVLGYSERSPDGKSCYIAQSYISPQGVIVNHRRKAKPTGVERNLWGDGGTEALSTVIDTPFGRLGALCCAEHIMPLLRFHEYTQGVQIHVASWPMTFETHRLEEPIEGHEDYIVDLHASRFMAREGCCFVLVATQVLSEKSFENCGIREGKEFVRKVVVSPRTWSEFQWLLILTKTEQDGGGHSMIYDPWGKPLAKSLAKEGEGILHADINIEDTTSPATMVDIVGHSARPDLLSLLVGNPPAITTRME